jgi:hypothetical protein
MRRIKTATTASTSRMCINPPRVYELTMPNSQRINNKTAIVQSIGTPFLNLFDQLTSLKFRATHFGEVSSGGPIRGAISLYEVYR